MLLSPSKRGSLLSKQTLPAQQVTASQEGDQYEGVAVEEVVTKKVDTAQPVQHTLLCEVQGCGYKTPESQSGPAIRWLTLHQKYVHSEDDIIQTVQPVQGERVVTKSVHTTQLVQQEKVDIKPVHTAQPVQQEKAVPKKVETAQPVQNEKGDIKPVHTAQPVQQEKVAPILPCELEGCVYVIHRDGGMPLWFAVERL